MGPIPEQKQPEQPEPEQKNKVTVMTSWDDDDTPFNLKLAKMLFDYNIQGLFFLTNKSDSYNIRKLYGMGMEIGGHTVNHPKLTDLSLEDVASEIIENKHYLEEAIKGKITSFAYPKGRYNYDIKRIVASCGYLMARTTKVLSVNQSPDFFELHTTVHAYNRDEYKGVSWENVALTEWAKIRDAGQGFFHLWGHSWELEKWEYWDKLSMVLAKISQDIKILNSKK